MAMCEGNRGGQTKRQDYKGGVSPGFRRRHVVYLPRSPRSPSGQSLSLVIKLFFLNMFEVFGQHDRAIDL